MNYLLRGIILLREFKKIYLKNCTIYSTNSRISAGWQSKVLQIASKVENRIAFALPVFKMERFAIVISNFSESSVSDIFRFAIITSKFTIMGMGYTVRSCSCCKSNPLLKIVAKIRVIKPTYRFVKSRFL
jgi:hypothetical protein